MVITSDFDTILRRDEHFKAKRAHTTTEDNSIMELPVSSIKGPQVSAPLVDIGIEKALSFIG